MSDDYINKIISINLETLIKKENTVMVLSNADLNSFSNKIYNKNNGIS